MQTAGPGRGHLRGSRLEVASLALLVAVVWYLLAYPLDLGRADESHLLYGARRLFDGEVLYAEIFEIITPLAFYLFAAVYWLAGATLFAARAAMALVEAAGAIALFRLVVRCAGPSEALLGVLVFVVLCVPIWPYASAHWISTALAAIVAAVVLGGDGAPSVRRAVVAGLLVGVGLCVQQQRGVFLALWLPLAYGVLATGLPRGARLGAVVRQTTWAAGVALVVVVVVLGHAAWMASPALLVEMLFGFAVHNYADKHAGPGWAAIAPLTGDRVAFGWHWLLRWAPLLPVLEAGRLAFRRPWGDAERVRATLVLLAASMALAVAYLPDAIHVAFVLPFLVVPGLCLVHDLRTAGGAGRARVGVIAVWTGVLVIAMQGTTNLRRAWAESPVRWESAFGTLDTNAGRAELARAVAEHLVAEPDGRRLLYSFPADAWLYLALPVANPIRFDVMVPALFPRPYVDEVVANLRAQRPGTVVRVTQWPHDDVSAAIDAGYDRVQDVGTHTIYVRRPRGS